VGEVGIVIGEAVGHIFMNMLYKTQWLATKGHAIVPVLR
jgi:hypothetical protein